MGAMIQEKFMVSGAGDASARMNRKVVNRVKKATPAMAMPQHTSSRPKTSSRLR